MSSQYNYLLTDTSPRDKTPENNPIQLWSHQEAMLHKIREIENNSILCKTTHVDSASERFFSKKNISEAKEVCLGIMNDPPGSGKTYAILTHVLTDTNPGPTIIITPHNIYGQWQKAIKIVFKKQIHKCKFLSTYEDVMNIYENPNKVQFHKIVLIQDSLAEQYLKTLNDNKIAVCRIIIDEVDIIDKYICSSINTKFVWLLSASYKGQSKLGPYIIENPLKILCKCDTEFVNNSINIPSPITKTIHCDTSHIRLFDGLLDEKYMNALKAGDYHVLNRIMNVSGQVTLENFKETAKKYADYLMDKSKLSEEPYDYYSAKCRKYNNYDSDEDSDSSYSSNFSYISYKENKQQKYYNLLKNTYRYKGELLQSRINNLKSQTDESQYKEKYLEDEFVKIMLCDKASKWLFFNDNGNTLIKYHTFLGTKEIKSKMLDGGNYIQIDKILNEYKEGDVQVLLLNSLIEGAGMNLENTTHLVFMHKTDDTFVEQVIGRAQRYGRTAPLNIIKLI